MAVKATTLRDRQSQLTRDVVLRALVELLDSTDRPSEISVPEVARRSGVSLRTVYRHFSTREELFAAAAEWISENLFEGSPVPRSAEELGQTYGEVAERFDEHPNLVRAMALSEDGRVIRAHRREQRLEAIRAALAEVTDRLPRDEVRRAEAVFFYLENMLAWVTMRDEAGLDGEEVGQAVAWAMRTLVDDLRRRNAAALEPTSQSNERRQT